MTRNRRSRAHTWSPVSIAIAAGAALVAVLVAVLLIPESKPPAPPPPVAKPTAPATVKPAAASVIAPRPTKPTSVVSRTWKVPRLKASQQKELLSPADAVRGNCSPGISVERHDEGPTLNAVVSPGGNVNQSAIIMLVDKPVSKGDRLTLSFHARSLDGHGVINIRVGNTTTSYSATVDRDVALGELWKPYMVCWTAPADVGASVTDVRLRFGKVTQRAQVRQIRVLSQGRGEVAWVATPSRDWRAIDLRDPDIVPGSALDFSGLVDHAPAGMHGRVIVGKGGRLAFEKAPAKRAAFWGCSVNMGPGGAFSFRHDIATIDGDHHHAPLNREDIEAFANRVRNQGYNIFRPHFLDSALMEHAKPDQTFDPVVLDRFDYLVHCLKRNGIYVYLDAATRPGAYSHGGGWGGDGVNRKMRIYHDPVVREEWTAAVKALLTHVNPYTGMALADDPVLAVLLFYNEQEMDPWGMQYFPPDVLPGLRIWLRKKYASDDKLRAAWTDGTGRCWLPKGETLATVTADNFWGNSPRSRDINLYIYETEREMLEWYEETIRTIGYEGVTTQYDAGMRYRNTAVRSSLQGVSIHAYAAPVNGWIKKGGRQHQNSSIGAPDNYRDLLYVRYTTTARYVDRPLFVTEYNHEFWNPYRHEQGIAMAGYGAFQDYDMLISHAHPVMLSVDRPMVTYFVGADPINRATEVVSGLLFARRDVSPARHHLTFGLDREFLFDQGRSGGGFVWEHEQDRLSLVTGFGIAFTDEHGETHGRRAGTTHYSIPSMPSAAEILGSLRGNGVVPRTNRTDFGRGRFETTGGQLYLQRGRSQLEVVTPRTQGATLMAGARVEMPVLNIEAASVDAAITVSALDDAELARSKRMLLVIATDALNTDMAFAALDRTELVSIGNAPALVRTGRFSLRLRNTNAASLRLWGLSMTGARARTIPADARGGDLRMEIDTTTLAEPYLFYEIAQARDSTRR